ncbi:putative methyltransferase [Apostichopus japonicus]|uniref:Putative methyltransferase n=1 Tax=Stichopus japonicus TaxID=307972 RepID=A0A2G8KUQ3_STIJA|nr:putative methyltransferase [Apostichopus japonicus]
MAESLFEDADIAKYYQAYRPDYAGLGIEKELISFMGRKLTRSENVNTLAIDVGCGSGQLTRVLAPMFTKVIGIDRSKSQINVAKEVTTEKNIEYVVNVAEDFSFLQDVSVDLVTSALAVHFFEPEPFFSEVDRVLKPGGCFLVLLGSLQGISLKTLTNDDKVNNYCSDMIKEVLGIGLQEMREDTKKAVTSGTYPAPKYADKHYFEVEASRKHGNIDEFVGFLKSSGGLIKHQKQHPDKENLIEKTKERLLLALADISSTPEETPVVVTFRMNCHLYRKPI